MIQPVAQANQLGQFLAVLAVTGELFALIKKRHVNILHHVELRDEVVRLENESNLLAAHLGEGAVAHEGDILLAEKIPAGSGLVEAAEDVEHGGLARTGRTHDGHVAALLDIDAHSGQSRHLHLAEVINLGQFFNSND